MQEILVQKINREKKVEREIKEKKEIKEIKFLKDPLEKLYVKVLRD
jgi:hypothetical protein